MNGKVLSVNKSNFSVEVNNKIVEVQLKGSSRQDKLEIVPGDNVELILKEDKYFINKILKRRNQLPRPKLANIDNLILLASIKDPLFNEYLVDKMITLFQYNAINVILIITKTDLATKHEISQLTNTYESLGYNVFTNSKSNEISENKKLLSLMLNKTNIITGQSGVGKTTMLNKIFPDLNAVTSKVSEKTSRGKHTTTKSSFYKMDTNTYLVDTPGFSAFDLDNMSPELCASYFLNFEQYLGNCKHKNCLHDDETDCHIKKLVDSKKISEDKYLVYKKVLSEAKKKYIFYKNSKSRTNK